MSINDRLQRLLDQRGVSYTVVPHREAFTALETAQSVHVSGREMAKVVVARDDAGEDFMLVLPASEHFDRDIFRHATSRTAAHLDDESELRRLFPDCEIGAMPPFGHLYGLPMYVDPCLAEREEICFQAGNHREVVLMRFQDFEKLARPLVSNGCLHKVVEMTSG